MDPLADPKIENMTFQIHNQFKQMRHLKNNFELSTERFKKLAQSNFLLFFLNGLLVALAFCQPDNRATLSTSYYC